GHRPKIRSGACDGCRRAASLQSWQRLIFAMRAPDLRANHNERVEENVDAHDEENGHRGSCPVREPDGRRSRIGAGAVAAKEADRDWSPWRSGEAGVLLHATIQGHDRSLP